MLDTSCSCSIIAQCASQQLVRREASSLTTTTNTESVTAVTKSLLLDTLNLVGTTVRLLFITVIIAVLTEGCALSVYREVYI